MDLIKDAAKNIATRLTWHTAGRDQAGIAQELADGEDIPEVYGLGETGLFDEFFYFLDHFGFKIWVVWDPNSKLPLALRFTTIEVADINLAREVIEQAVTNLGEHARIASIAMDRGFMDGTLLWWLNTKDIIFYIPAKSNMAVYEDALALTDKGILQTRDRKRGVGAGKNKTFVTDHWEVAGIEGLTTAGFYGPHGSGSHKNRKDFVANPINAAVVLDNPFMRNNPNVKTLVILTNGPISKPLKVYDGYDARSEIENSMFREAKQAWYIQRAPENTRAGFQAHVYLTVLVMALTTAFQTWMDMQDKLERAGEETGIRKFREQLQEENGNQLIIFNKDRYAIFYAYEVFILCGRNVISPNGVPERITKEDILSKYGALIE